MNDDLISRQAAIDVAKKLLDYYGANDITKEFADHTAEQFMNRVSSAQPERKKGKWVEKHHAYSDEEAVIEEWQSCRCSECGRYDTRPYMYYFDEPNYCSYCGAKMDEEKE